MSLGVKKRVSERERLSKRGKLALGELFPVAETYIPVSERQHSISKTHIFTMKTK